MMRSKIPAIEALSEKSQALYDVLNNEGDLSCVLISTSYLDQCLASLLERFLIKSSISKNLLDPRYGTLGTFSARVDLCYCLGLVPKGLFQNLRTLSEIRNSFAHSYLSLSFDDPKVAHLCKSFTFPKAIGKRVEDNTGKSYELVDPFEQFKDPRSRFTIIVSLMVNRLLVTDLSTEPRMKKEKGWD
jgi:DNA-binding MltR family transcriptional regulator